MRELAANVLVNLLSDILLLSLVTILFFVIAQMSRNVRRSRLIEFFRLNPKQPEITFYLSRHHSVADLPTINTDVSNSKSTIALERIKTLQSGENQKRPQESKLDIKSFTTVSAIEMIEALRLKDELQKPALYDWLPHEIQEKLRRNRAAEAPVKVNIEVCPDPADYTKLNRNGTMVFIGGPRANLGTYYYLFGEKAGKVRPRRLTSEKNVIEYMDSDSEPLTCSPDRNLAIIQRSIIGERTIIYLAGTGVNGTAAAVAYLRKNWRTLEKKRRQKDFYVVVECYGRKEENLSDYISKDWIGNEWWIRAEL